MPHYKCVTCTTRVTVAGALADACEGCGSALEPVGELSGIVGYRLVTRADADGEGFEMAVAMALETTGPRMHGDERTR